MRAGDSAVSPVRLDPCTESAGWVLRDNVSVLAIASKSASLLAANISRLPKGSEGLFLSAITGLLPLEIWRAAGSDDRLLVKMTALPDGISARDTVKRTGCDPLITPNQEATAPAASSVLGEGCERKTKGMVVVD